jgi:NitT/TauT family transport system permease protein
MKITFGALLLAVVAGVALAMLFALNKWVERSLFPFAIVLQVTRIVAIAPLILIYISSTTAALLLCAWIVAFFPILSNTIIGLKSADHNLRHLLIPSAMPYFIAGLKIAGGLSLIGAVVAEFTAGAAGKETGLAARILEASFRTEIPEMFAALVLVSFTGVLIYLAFNLVSKAVLGSWHESEVKNIADPHGLINPGKTRGVVGPVCQALMAQRTPRFSNRPLPSRQHAAAIN